MASRIDWAFGRGHGPVAGVVNAALAAGAAVTVMHYRHVNPAWALFAGVILAVVSVFVVLFSDRVVHNRAAIAFRAGLCIAAGIWAFHQLRQPWTGAAFWHGARLLGEGAAVAAVVGWLLAWFNNRALGRVTPEQPKPAKQSALSMRAREYKRTINTVCHISSYDEETGAGGVEVVAIEDWPQEVGFTIEGKVPDDGTTIFAIKSYETNLAHAWDLPPGCKVEVQGSTKGRRTFLMRVRTRNLLAEPQVIPPDLSHRSINDPIPIGVQIDLSPATIDLRFFSGAMIGAPNSGKSNQLGVILHNLMRCNDVFIAGIDITGAGRLFRPLIYPYLERVTDKPAIDFVAVDEAQAEQMCQGIIEVINERTRAYGRLMRENDVDFLPVSKTLPQIMLIIDEWGELNPRIRELVIRIANIGRGGATRVLVCALRAKNNSGLPRELLAKAPERIAMKTTDEAELQALLDTTWKSGRFDPRDFPGSGFGVWTTGGLLASMFKGFRILPSELINTAIKTAARRPALDTKSVEVWNRIGGFADRWEYTLPRMFGDEYTGPSVLPFDVPEQRASFDAGSSGVATAVERAGAAVEAAKLAQRAAWVDRVRPAAPHVRYQTLMREGAPVTATELWQHMREEGYDTHRATIIDWFNADIEAGRVQKLPKVGREVPYVWIGD